MRIIGGKHRSRQLKMVGKPTTRETADMVRESVFNMLGGTITGVVLDLFAGSGAYGLEALSRGATFVHSIDHDPDAIKTIKANALLLKEEQNLSAVVKDYNHYLSSLPNPTHFDLIFLDPPYDMDVYGSIITALIPYTDEGSRIVCESKKQLILPDTIDSFHKIKDKVYGIKRITIYEKEAKN